jgi:hypothetical protein
LQLPTLAIQSSITGHLLEVSMDNVEGVEEGTAGTAQDMNSTSSVVS